MAMGLFLFRGLNIGCHKEEKGALSSLQQTKLVATHDVMMKNKAKGFYLEGGHNMWCCEVRDEDQGLLSDDNI